MTNLRTFLSTTSGARSHLIGAPEDFDFLVALRDAVSIKCAIAFGHMTGWRKVDAALKASKGKSIQILLGQAFLQTEPDLLDLLRAGEAQEPLFQGRLAPTKPTFHPKVWIIQTPRTSHLIIGSANLSEGGFVRNSECSAYLNDPTAAASIERWFDECWKNSARLNSKVCLNYETYQLTREGIRTPDQIGKNRKHWGTLYMRLQVQLLQERLQEQQAMPRRRK
jgi:HKD family nuclease